MIYKPVHKFRPGHKVRFIKQALENRAWTRATMEGVFTVAKVERHSFHFIEPAPGDQITLVEMNWWKPSSWLLELAED